MIEKRKWGEACCASPPSPSAAGVGVGRDRARGGFDEVAAAKGLSPPGTVRGASTGRIAERAVGRTTTRVVVGPHRALEQPRPVGVVVVGIRSRVRSVGREPQCLVVDGGVAEASTGVRLGEPVLVGSGRDLGVARADHRGAAVGIAGVLEDPGIVADPRLAAVEFARLPRFAALVVVVEVVAVGVSTRIFDVEVEVAARRASGGADRADDLALPNPLVQSDVDIGEMRVPGVVGVRIVVELDVVAPATTAARARRARAGGAHIRDDPVSHGHHGLATLARVRGAVEVPRVAVVPAAAGVFVGGDRVLFAAADRHVVGAHHAPGLGQTVLVHRLLVLRPGIDDVVVIHAEPVLVLRAAREELHAEDEEEREHLLEGRHVLLAPYFCVVKVHLKY